MTVAPFADPATYWSTGGYLSGDPTINGHTIVCPAYSGTTGTFTFSQ